MPDGIFDNIDAVWENSVYDVADNFLNGCKLAYAKKNLQRFNNLLNVAKPDNAFAFGYALSGQTALAGSATT